MDGESPQAARVSLSTAVDRIIAQTGGDIRIALPLGLGKPNQLINLLYQRVKAAPNLSLSIFTALSLGRPKASSELERRFLAPFLEKVYADYVELDYLKDLRGGALPENVQVYEFFFQPGSMLGNRAAQQNYISANYTHVARDVDARGVNVVAQLVATNSSREGKVSLSCNPEVSLDLLPLIEKRRQRGETVLMVGQLHEDLPYMLNDAEVESGLFDLLIEEEGLSTRLFSTPNMPVSRQDHFVGLYASTLIADDGLLQIGIGALGDALVHHLLMRHHDNNRYRKILAELGATVRFRNEINRIGAIEKFSHGLYGCSEMVTAGMLALLDGDVIRRAVLDDADLQSLLNSGEISEQVSLQTLDALIEQGVLNKQLTESMLSWMRQQGLLRETVLLKDNRLYFSDGHNVANDLDDPVVRQAVSAVLSKNLPTTLLHGGFFLGPTALYRRLAEMSDAQRMQINMTRISFINDLAGNEKLKRLQRHHARFINTAFSATLLGAGIADALESGQVLSGVGGQYNFVAQAHQLEGARSVIMLRSWRERAGETHSNILWSYGHNTIPRHLRDIFITEYGIADLRGKTDSECVAAMLNISDSRFQQALLQQAKDAGKISTDYSIPEIHRRNTPDVLADIYQAYQVEFPRFPLGSDFSEIEQSLLTALTWLKEKISSREYFRLGRAAIKEDVELAEQFSDHLQRMGLDSPEGLKEMLYRRLVLTALAATH